jgi:hypothetical protein
METPLYVRKAGPATVGKCALQKPGCLSSERGPVTPYVTSDGAIRISACRICVEHYASTGSWIETPSAPPSSR